MKLSNLVKIEHPEAVAALIASSHLDGKTSDQITEYINTRRINRRLFVLAVKLRRSDNRPGQFVDVYA